MRYKLKTVIDKDLDKIYKVCSETYGYDFDMKSRKYEHILARASFFKAVMLYKKYFKSKKCSFAKMSGYLNLDHASALHSLNNFDSYCLYYGSHNYKLSIHSSFNEINEHINQQLDVVFNDTHIKRVIRYKRELENANRKYKNNINQLCKHFEDEAEDKKKNFVW